MRSSQHNTVAAAIGGGMVLGLAAFLAGRAIVRARRRISVEGQVALITGGSRGIGLQIALELARRGAKIAIAARNEQELRAASEEIGALGGEVLAITTDVTRVVSCGEAVQQTIDRFGSVDILVNSAGTISAGPVSHMKLEDYRHAMDTNFFGALHCMLAVLPEMRRRRDGRIVNIASFGGKVPSPHAAPYAASKFALVGLSETLRAEVADNGIYVTTVNPFFVRDGGLANAQFKGDHEAEKALGMTMSNLPLVTIDPRVLAKRVVNAIEHGDAEVNTPWISAVQSRLHGMFPGMSQEVLALINRLLPGRTAGGDAARQGSDLSDRKAPKWAKAAQKRGEKKFQKTNPRTT